jgi:ABC-2 type transport system permease protein
MNLNVIAAIFRRNFVSYFSNPTGYVFICVFVLLGSFAAFWPDEFFNANLANLDQLNKWFPYIMLVFIPAITMSIWADERKQGTDELLLTIPAADIDVVLGKYTASVAIYTVALLFSLVCNLWVLFRLGFPDVGLFLGNYFGYWLVGLAMLAIGMVASFLTGNLTVAFILGVVFNAPLVFLNVIDAIAGGSNVTSAAKGWSIGEQMSDFGHGVISFASICYFLLIAAVMLYLCMVLIGRRHWLGGREGKSLGPHYVVRALALVAVAAGVSLLVQNWNVRADVTEEQLNSVSAESKKLISNLDPKYPVVIDAFISPNIPEEFVQTRMDLLNLLREFEKLSHGKIQVKFFTDIEPLTKEAETAEQQFGIVPQEVFTQAHGMWKQEQVYLAAGITCGLEKMVIPFFERGIPVEYELVRSLATITQQKRKRVGILQTDAELMGGFDFSGGMPQQRPKERLVDELEKQYDVVRVDPSNPITERYDVLLAIQPSSLPQPQLTNFINAVKSGQPTAIFEDPLPAYLRGAPGTSMPRRQRQNPMMPFGQPQMEPKGDINQLWDLLGVELIEKSRRGGGFFGSGSEQDCAVIWQAFKPKRFEGIEQLTPEYVFISADAPHTDEHFEPFNEKDRITSGLQELILPLPGGILARNKRTTEFTPLVTTGNKDTGTIMAKELTEVRNPMEIRVREGAPTNQTYALAARITGRPNVGADEDAADAAAKKDNKDAAKKDDAKADDSKSEKSGESADKSNDKPEKAAAAKKPVELDVVLVADADLLASLFFDTRARRMPDNELEITTDNVTFVLNVLDSLANDERFIDIRKRRPIHRPLSAIVASTEQARTDAETARNGFEKARSEKEKELEQAFTNAENDLNTQMKDAKLKADPAALQQTIIDLTIKLKLKQREKEVEEERLRKEAQKQIDQSAIDLNTAVRGVQNRYKMYSVFLPPVLPLAVAFFVFFNRRAKEREGVSKARLR